MFVKIRRCCQTLLYQTLLSDVGIRHRCKMWDQTLLSDVCENQTLLSDVDIRHCCQMLKSAIVIRCGNQTFLSDVEIKHCCQMWEPDIVVRCEDQILLSDVKIRHCFSLFVWVEALRPSQQFFSHVWTE